MKSIRLAVMALSAIVALTVASTAQEVVRITNIGHGYFSGPLYVAMREGLFEKHGLKPEVTFVKGGALAFQSVFTREVEFSILSYEHILTAAAQGRDLVAIFNVAHRPLNNVVVSNELLKQFADKSLEEKVQALKGKRVGTPSAGGSGEKMLGVLARENGLQLPGDLELVYLGGDPASYVGAFQNNVIDAAMPFEPAGVMIEEKELGGTLINLMDGEVEAFKDLIFMTVATHPDQLKENPELARKVAAVFAEAQEILLDEERGIAIMAAEFSNMAPEANERAYRKVRPIWSPDGRMTLDGAKKVFDYLQPEGDQAIEFENTFSNEYLPSR